MLLVPSVFFIFPKSMVWRRFLWPGQPMFYLQRAGVLFVMTVVLSSGNGGTKMLNKFEHLMRKVVRE